MLFPTASRQLLQRGKNNSQINLDTQLVQEKKSFQSHSGGVNGIVLSAGSFVKLCPILFTLFRPFSSPAALKTSLKAVGKGVWSIRCPVCCTL